MLTNPTAGVPSPLPTPPTLSERQRLVLGTLAVLAGVAMLALSLRVHLHSRVPAGGVGIAPVGGQGVVPAGGLAIIIAIPVVLWRRWPLPLLVLTTAVVAVDLGTGRLSLALCLLLGFASYTVGWRVPRRSSILAVLTTAVVLGGVLMFVWFTKARAPVPLDAVLGFVPPAAAWFVGDSIAARRRYLAGLAEQAERERIAELERAQREISEERVRIARELHDVIAHGLAVITVQAGVGRRLMAKRSEEAASALASIETIGRTAQEELRVVLGLLRDSELGPAALTPAPGLPDLGELVEHVRAAGTPVDLHVSGMDGQLSPVLELSVYRVIQEALTNVVKHAPGARATVDLAVGDREVSIAVTDDGGCSMPPVADPHHAGHGIVGMRERVGAFGGSLTAQPAPVRGFRVLARIPLQDSA